MCADRASKSPDAPPPHPDASSPLDPIDAADQAAQAEADAVHNLEKQLTQKRGVFRDNTARLVALKDALVILLAAQGFPVLGGAEDSVLKASGQSSLDPEVREACQGVSLALMLAIELIAGDCSPNVEEYV